MDRLVAGTLDIWRSRPRGGSSQAATLLAIVVSLGMYLAACGSSPGTTTPPSQTALDPARPSLAARDMDEAIRFRESFGMRADPAWVMAVAQDPSSVDEYGTLMTPEEAAAFERRTADAHEVKNRIVGYAKSQPEFAGLETDQRRNAITVRFTDRVDEHRTAIFALVPDATVPIDVVEVRFTRDELKAVARRAMSDKAFLRSIEAHPLSAGVDTQRNFAVLEISSTNPDAPALIIDHFDAHGMLTVESDGIGSWLWPTGTLVVKAVDPLGRPVEGLLVTAAGDIPGTGTGDVGLGTGKDGALRLDLRAPPGGSAGYRIELKDAGRVVGVGHGSVQPGRETTLQVGMTRR